MKAHKLGRTALVAAAVASAAVIAAPTASSAGTYADADRIHSIVAWSGSNCMAFSWWEQDGSRGTGTSCSGVFELDQVAAKGRWVGVEPRPASDTAFACAVYNYSNGQTLRQNSHFWDTFSGSVGGILDTPSNHCMVQLN